MADASSGSTGRRTRSLLDRLSGLLSSAPEDREDLLEVLREAHRRELLDADALAMIEGVMQAPDLTARDIMVPRAQIVSIDLSEPPEDIVPAVVRSGHSRFPVIDGDRDDVLGILHAKDLLRFYAERDFDLHARLRPPLFIPESKRLDVLLRDFRLNRNHLAIVVDEYGGVSGMVTIEDVLEQIVGDIEDEFDADEHADDIVPADSGSDGGRWRVRAIASIASVNAAFGTGLPEDDLDTIGGLVVEQLGRVPVRGERLQLGPLACEVLRADARQVHLLLVERAPEASATADALAEPPAADR